MTKRAPQLKRSLNAFSTLENSRTGIDCGGLAREGDFEVQLPLSSVVQAPVREMIPRQQTSNLSGLRILLVDDLEDNLVLFGTWLQNSGAKIKTLDSASNVVSVMATFKPEILLSDINMPGEDGYALIAKVRALPEEMGGKIPAGALTALVTPEDRTHALSAGFNLHIPKPVTRSRLLEAVRSLAEFSRLKVADLSL